MRKCFLMLILTVVLNTTYATVSRDTITPNAADVSSVDGIVAALYDVISGPAGQTRNWDRMRTLFMPEAKLVATGRRDGRILRRVMSVEDYITANGPALEKNGWIEAEIGRKTEQYDNLVHLFSTYAAKRSATDEKPFMRGINSFQLWNDGKRWWIVNLLWQWESPDAPIPGKYINK